MHDVQSDKPSTDRVLALVEAARRAGADAADAATILSQSTSVNVRVGQVESTDASQSDDVTLRVFVGGAVAAVSASGSEDPDRLAERAVAMAKVSPVEKHRTLADPSELSSSWADLDLVDDTRPSVDDLVEHAIRAEAAGREVDKISNSIGASASYGRSGLALATSHGFVGTYEKTRFGRSAQLVAQSNGTMERDYDFSTALHFEDLREPEEIGRLAAERAVARLDARKAPTGTVSVIFDPRVARGLAGTLGSAINASSVVRKTSFLRDKMGEQVAHRGITLTDDPTRRRGSGSRPFDGEGVSGAPLTMIDGGVLQHWFLATTAANELGLHTNGRGARSGAQVVPTSTNLAIEPGTKTPDEMIAEMERGFYVTELIGQGVNLVTGDYSRGASGFWIDNGRKTHAVTEVTIAGNLRDMFMALEAANDLDRSFPTASPTLRIEAMTLAGS